MAQCFITYYLASFVISVGIYELFLRLKLKLLRKAKFLCVNEILIKFRNYFSGNFSLR